MVSFSLFAAIIGLVLIPYQLIDYNLAVNLFTSSIFTVLTIIFLSWLFDLREKAEWHAVREEVFFLIKLELIGLFTITTDYFKGGVELKNSLMSEKDKERNIQLVGDSLKNLCLSSIRSDNYTVNDFFQQSKEIESFLDAGKKLSEIQVLYSRHLPAEITVSLMKIQQHIGALEYSKKFHTSFNKLSPSDPLYTSFSKQYENIRIEMLKPSLVNILCEIKKLHSRKELEFSYPPL